jgi:hypothetical protein
MQRLILFGLLGAFALMIAAVGGYWWMKQNREDQRWVPMPVNPGSSLEEREELQKQIETHMRRDAVVKSIVSELSLAQRWNVGSEAEAAERFKQVMFVRLGEFRHPATQETFATIDIGVKGKRKEQTLLEEIATRMARETRDYLGLGQ